MTDEARTGDGPTAVPAPSKALGPRAVRRHVILAAVVVVLVTSAVRIVSSGDDDRPTLVAGGVVSYQGPERREIRPPGEDGAYVFRYHPGEPFSLGFTIRNINSRSVHVLGFPYDNRSPYHLHTGVWTGERNGGYTENLIPFQPFTLGPDESRYVELRYRFAQCKTPPVENTDAAQFGGGVSWDRQAIRHRMSGKTREMQFDLPAAVGLEGAMGDCPWPPA